MTNKEILAELKRSYEYLVDIRENGRIRLCSGQMKDNLDKLDESINNVEDIYSDFYKILDKQELKINRELLGNELYISNSISGGYDVFEIDGAADCVDYVTCEDIGYYWYEDYKFLNKVKESE